MRESTFEDAAGLCKELGSRLCTAAELGRGEGVPEACGYNSAFAWSWIKPGGGVAQCAGNSSLGVGGQPGEWFSFRPTAANAFLEVQLVAEGLVDGEASIVPDIFDGHGDRVPTPVPPTLHFRHAGSMLRWNTSTAGTGPFFVRAVAPFQHSVVVASPQPYQVVLEEVRSPDWSAAAPLSVADAAVGVRLPFPFKFFGVEHGQIWVGASGYISFEEQRSGSFADVGSAHSAIIACGGQFELDGAAVTMMQSETELQVRWRGSLFESTEVSDVSLSLHRDGSMSIGWAAIHLSGGSLEFGLSAWLLSDPERNMSLTEGAQISDESESGSTLAGAIMLSGPAAAAKVVPMDASRYKTLSAQHVSNTMASSKFRSFQHLL